VSSSYRGYASVNGQQPLSRDGDGYQITEVAIPALQIPDNILSINYIVGWISAPSVVGVFSSTDVNKTTNLKDVIDFCCNQTQSININVPQYSTETIYSDVVAPDEIYASSAITISNENSIVAYSYTDGVDVWADGNIVCARINASTIFGDWHPFIHSGYYTIGEKQYYLFADKKTEVLELDNDYCTQISPYPKQGAPVIVVDSFGKQMRSVAFIDDGGNMTLYNIERFSGLDVDTIYLMFADIENVDVTLNDQNIDYMRYGNRLVLPSPLDVRDNLVVRYRLSNSYYVAPYAAFARQQNRIGDIPVTDNILKFNKYSIFDVAYIAPQYL
jgi:hypothetical protein